MPEAPGPDVPFPPMEAELVAEVPDGAGPGRPSPADGGRARGRGARRRRLAVRAEVGRLPRCARERQRRARALVAQRAPAAALLPGAARARRAAAEELRARRR